jgi:hypothetical protein
VTRVVLSFYPARGRGQGAPPRPKAKQRADVNGNPRHEGAIARRGTGQRNEASNGQRRHVTAVAVSPGGKTAVTRQKDAGDRACLWELTSGKLLRRLRPEDGRESWIVWCAAVTPDGKAAVLAHPSAGVTFRDKQAGCIKVVLKPWG